MNLIVGANNLGKTSLLEALSLYFSQGSRSRIVDLLLAREEFSFKKLRLKSINARDVNLAYELLFFGRPNLDERPTFEIGPLWANLPYLRVSFTWLQELTEELKQEFAFVL